MATAAASASSTSASSSSATTTSAIVDEETADEVKVFRSSAQEDDPTESSELNADKHELAMEADIESQADFSQRVNPIFNPLGPLPWPSPGNNIFYNMLAMSPVFQAAQQKMAINVMAQAYAAATIARLSPHYMNLGGPFGSAFERPPAFSMPCTPSSNGTRNGQMGGQPQMNSPMTSLSGGIGGVSLSADRAANMQRQQQQRQPGNNRTPKREKGERKEKQSAKAKAAVDNKKEEHIKKPMNAFMLFMKENRHKYMDECGDKRKQSAELNKELGQIWQKMTRDEQEPYYQMAQRKREEHAQLYPNWTARENYAIHKRAKKRRTRERSLENNELKKCRARFGVDQTEKWCKHCRRKKRCLNVRDSHSPVQVSSTTNPTTPLSLAGPSGFSGLGSVFGHHSTTSQDSPHSSRKDCGQSTSELSRCSSTTSSTDSNVSADDGPAESGGRHGQPVQKKAHLSTEKEQKHQPQQQPNNGFKMELDAPKAAAAPMPIHHPLSQSHQMELPKPVPNQQQQAPPGPFQMPANGAAGVGFPFQANPFMHFGMNAFMPPFMKQ